MPALPVHTEVAVVTRCEVTGATVCRAQQVLAVSITQTTARMSSAPMEEAALTVSSSSVYYLVCLVSIPV